MMAVKTRDALKSDIDAAFADNNTGAITPLVLRQQARSLADSSVFPEDEVARTFFEALALDVETTTEPSPGSVDYDPNSNTLSFLLPAPRRDGAPEPILIYPEDFGAVGDGETDDADAIQAAIDAARDAGGGTVTGDRAKTYLVHATRPCDEQGRLAHLIARDGVHIREMNLLRRRADTGVRYVVYIEEAYGGSMRDLAIDVNDPEFDSVDIHGIFKHRAMENYLIADVEVRNASAYGLGLQDSDGTETFGYTRRSVFRNLRLLHSGNDGMDIKNNDPRTGYNTFSDVYVDGFAMDPATSGRTGAHFRGGHSHYSRITVKNPGPGALRGIAIHTNLPDNLQGQITLDQFNVNGVADDGTIPSPFQGLLLAAPLITASSGHIQFSGDSGTGVLVASDGNNCSVSGVTAAATGGGGAQAFFTAGAANAGILFTNCLAIRARINYQIRSPGVYLASCASVSPQETHFSFASQATGCTLVGGGCRGGGTFLVNDAGDLQAAAVRGIPNL